MEKNSEISEVLEKNKNADYTGYSEKQIDLDVDKRTGQVQQQKRSRTLTQQTVMQKRGNSFGKKKVVTVFQKHTNKKV